MRLGLLLLVGSVLQAQQVVSVDLAQLARGNRLTVLNRAASVLDSGSMKGVRLDARAGDGVAYIPNVEFANGTIEFDVRGKDVQGQSFVGIAFHGVDSATYDGIYFRPFNFRTTDAARQLRSVQYISHPTHTWDKLRAETPGKYEKPATPPPDPNDWFHARVVVLYPTVSVYVGDASEPSLVLTQLSDRKKGRLGLWVGNGSSGDFRNLRITHSAAP
jgi:hypothetical protein